jgi:uncharacterized protein (DUF983 family)
MGFQGVRSSARMLARAVTLRCPNCGSRGVLASWFKLAAACPGCRLRLERGESDYFLGGMMFNIVLAESIFAVVLITTLVMTWPDVPWTALEYGAPAAMLVAPIALYPFSKLVWLAFDLALRPPSPNDFVAPSTGTSPGSATTS